MMSETNIHELADERAVPGVSDAGTMAFHVARYEWARAYCSGLRVLDAGCGVGYGTALIAESAAQVVGIDYEASAIEHARLAYGRANLSFRCQNLLSPPYVDAPYDVAVCFEVAEHLPRDFDLFGALASALSEGGVALVSTPNDLTWRHLEAANYEYHVNMRQPEAFRTEALEHFGEVELLGMRPQAAVWFSLLRGLDRGNFRLRLRLPGQRVRRLAGIAATEGFRPEDVVVRRDQVRQSHTLIAVCKEPRRLET